MAVTARRIRSNVVPAGRRKEDESPSRPMQLRVVRTTTASEEGRLVRGVSHMVSWTKARRAPMVHTMIAVIFLVGSLAGSLALRTEMAQNSFQSSVIEGHIAELNQDVEDDQAALVSLQASLPDKAQQMGMIPQQGSISIDLNGYHPSGGQQ